MPILITLAGFLGAWLLVAGPLRQAAIELGEEEVDRQRLEVAKRSATVPEALSPWWWLVPPVAFLKQRRRSAKYQAAVLSSLPPEQVEQWLQYSTKASAWAIVGSGGVLIAVKETWELVERLEWPSWSFWVIVPAGFLSCALNTALLQRQGQVTIATQPPVFERDPLPPPGPGS